MKDQKIKIKKKKENETQTKQGLGVQTLMCPCESRSVSFSLYMFAWKCSLQWVIRVVQGLWLLLHSGYWTLTGNSLRYPVVALCHGCPAALDLQVQSFHILRKFIDEVVVGLTHPLVLRLGSSWVGKPSSFPSLSPPGQALLHCPVCLTQSSRQPGVGPVLPLSCPRFCHSYH